MIHNIVGIIAFGIVGGWGLLVCANIACMWLGLADQYYLISNWIDSCTRLEK